MHIYIGSQSVCVSYFHLSSDFWCDDIFKLYVEYMLLSGLEMNNNFAE